MKLTTNFISLSLHGALALLFAAASTSVFAQANAIEAINVSPAAGGKVVVKVTLKQARANAPAGFTINNPPRIAFDFPNTWTQHPGGRRGRSSQHQRGAGR